MNIIIALLIAYIVITVIAMGIAVVKAVINRPRQSFYRVVQKRTTTNVESGVATAHKEGLRASITGYIWSVEEERMSSRSKYKVHGIETSRKVRDRKRASARKVKDFTRDSFYTEWCNI